MSSKTWTGGLVCTFSALLDSIATLFRLEELKRLFLEPPPVVLTLLLLKLWLLLRLAFMFILAAPTPGFMGFFLTSLLFMAAPVVNLPKSDTSILLCGLMEKAPGFVSLFQTLISRLHIVDLSICDL